MNRQGADQLFRRRVFYIPGYDPIHPRRYRELYRKEGAAQSQISGYDIALKPKKSGGNYGWHVDAIMDGRAAQADFDVLVWSDIVRGSMDGSIAGTYLQLVRTAWIYISTGALWRLMKLRKGPVIAALYPVGMLLLQLLLAGFAFWGIASLIGVGFGQLEQQLWPGRIFTPLFYPSIGLSLVAGGLCAIAVLRWFKRKDNRFYAYYLVHDYAYSAAQRGGYPAQLETRIAAFSDAIAAALQEDVGEVLVVGHSSGAYLAVSVLADLLRAGRVPETGPALGFLSLGQVVPMVSFLPKADRLRRDLHELAATDALTWVDVTAPGDGCAFALCDPVAVSGVAPEGKKWPLVFSAAFTQTLSPARWKALRWRFFRLHFQYLCAFDRPKDYDYFQITAGPIPLGQRYAGRPPSKSRIETPVNGFRNMAP
jgi:pimeloyl-ACP methyl ester carboxylesterase